MATRLGGKDTKVDLSVVFIEADNERAARGEAYIVCLEAYPQSKRYRNHMTSLAVEVDKERKEVL